MKTLAFLLLAVASSLADEDFSSGNRLFTASIYNELLADNENLIVSPFSLETILALTQSGAKEATAEEIRTTLHLPNDEEKTELLMKNILPNLQSENYTLHTANKIFVEKKFSLKENFKKVVTDVYQAGFETVNFAENQEAAEEINSWVEKETNNKIHDLISAADLDETTKLVLVNALYFQATWKYPFSTKLSQKMSFFTSARKEKNTEFMLHPLIETNYYESEELDAKFLEFPFEGEEATMTFVLPNEKDGLYKIEKLRDRIFKDVDYEKQGVSFYLPKFKIESKIDFGNVLKKLGVSKAFDPLEADFSGIAGEKGDLFISKVTQKTFINVDESGVEAAGATAVDVLTLSLGKQFVADHPFLFFIKVKDVVLFEGRVLEP